MTAQKYCLDCEKPIYKTSTRCKSCCQKGALGHTYIHGNRCKEVIKVIKPRKQRDKKPEIINYCLDCNIKISKRSKRCKSCSRKGTLNHFYGKHFTESASLKLSEKHKAISKWEGDKNPRVSDPFDGEKNPNWRGGISYGSIYPYKFKKKMRPLILETYTCCQWCGTADKLVVHHLDHNIRNNEFENLITLCHSCNIKEYWYMNKIKYHFFRKVIRANVDGELFENPYPKNKLNIIEKLQAEFNTNDFIKLEEPSFFYNKLL